MKPQLAIPIGLVMLALGVGIMLLTPGHATWGSNHMLAYWSSKVLVIFGVVWVVLGFVRRKQG